MREGNTVAMMEMIIPTITRTTAISMRVNTDESVFIVFLYKRSIFFIIVRFPIKALLYMLPTWLTIS
jgi:hypothetical protein